MTLGAAPPAYDAGVSANRTGVIYASSNFGIRAARWMRGLTVIAQTPASDRTIGPDCTVMITAGAECDKRSRRRCRLPDEVESPACKRTSFPQRTPVGTANVEGREWSGWWREHSIPGKSPAGDLSAPMQGAGGVVPRAHRQSTHWVAGRIENARRVRGQCLANQSVAVEPVGTECPRGDGKGYE